MNPRPKKAEEKKLTARFEVKYTEKEREEIIALSEAHGYNQYSTFIRHASLGHIQVDRSKIEKKKK